MPRMHEWGKNELTSASARSVLGDVAGFARTFSTRDSHPDPRDVARMYLSKDGVLQEAALFDELVPSRSECLSCQLRL